MKKLLVLSAVLTLAACSGSDGAAGQNGNDGSDGDDGASSLLVSTAEPAGDNCTNGGTRLDVGVDASGDGVLDEDEISGTSYACNGESGMAGSDGAMGDTGADGSSALINSTDEPAGSNCTSGGIRVDYGVDTDGNGTLDAGEVQGTSYVCNGADGNNSLIASTALAVGDTNCPAGGTQYDSGVDADDSGTLEAGEVTGTAYTCNGADGISTLIDSVVEPAGSNCAAGGVNISWGQDTNADDTLQSGEVTGTRLICDGVDGAPGADGATGADGAPGADGASGSNGLGALIDVANEAAGANCAAGGVRIQWGQDNNGNGTLEAGEVDGTDYVCDGMNATDPQCQQPYTTLDSADRNVSFNDGVGGIDVCDRVSSGLAGPQWNDSGWYRFEGAAGTQMPETAPSTYSCGTHAPGWLNGSHPSAADGVVSRQACFHFFSDTCNWSSTINVVNCGSFFLYELADPGVCRLRYCGE